MRANQFKAGKSAAWKAAEQAGYDMSLIEGNLRKTPFQRIRAHNRALATALMLRRGMEKRNGRA
jgi:hypothetical protein